MPTTTITHPIPRRLARSADGAALLQLLRKAGYHVELAITRTDGAEMTPHDTSSIEGLCAGYDADAKFGGAA